jgi:hypothetical protein
MSNFRCCRVTVPDAPAPTHTERMVLVIPIDAHSRGIRTVEKTLFAVA